MTDSELLERVATRVDLVLNEMLHLREEVRQLSEATDVLGARMTLLESSVRSMISGSSGNGRATMDGQ